MLSAARIVVVFGVVLQVAGFARLLVIAAFFGAGPLLDGYYLGLVIPTFLTGLAGGILQTSFVPAYVAAKSRGELGVAHQLASGALSWVFAVLSGIAVLLALLREPILHLFWNELNPAVGGALRAAFALAMWSAPLNALADAIAMLMNAEGKFAAAAAAPIINVVVSVAVLICWRDRSIDGMLWSLLAGLSAQVLVVAIGLVRQGIRLRPSFDLASGLPVSLLAIGIPVVISNVLGNFVPAFIQMIAARAGPGGVSAMGYATRLHNSVVQAVVMSISIVLLPHFARLITERRNEELRAMLERVSAATLLFFLASVVFVAVSGPTTLMLLLQRGQFTHADSQSVAAIWLALTTGLFGMTWGIFLVRLFQARQEPWVIARIAAVSVVINVVLAQALVPRWGVPGIAVANSIAYTTNMALFHKLAARRFGAILSGRAPRFIVAAVLFNLAAYAVAHAWGIWFTGAPLPITIFGQMLIIGCANLAAARLAPLGIPFSALLTR